MSEMSSTSSECDARDLALTDSNRMQSAATYRNYMRASKQRFGPAHQGRAVLNLAAKRWREMSPEHRARYRKPTAMFVPVEVLGDHDFEPAFECGVKPKKVRISRRQPKGSCGKGQSKRSKSSSAKRRRRKSAVAKRSKREAKKSCAGRSTSAKPKKPKKPKTPKTPKC